MAVGRFVWVRGTTTKHEYPYPEKYAATAAGVEIVKGESAYEDDGVTLREPKHNPDVAKIKAPEAVDTPNPGNVPQK